VTVDPHLFRRESARLVAALTRVFGVHNLALAEDVVQDALCRALEVWKFHGMPENPSAWLMTTAKNRALDVLRRERTARTFAPELGRLLESEWTVAPALEELLGPTATLSDELRMMFSCCDPRLREEVQVALVLHILCGFGTDEIANAFLCKEAAIEKRIARGKKVLAASKTLFDLEQESIECNIQKTDATHAKLEPPRRARFIQSTAARGSPSGFSSRLVAVRRALYLLFNEGYHGAGESAVRVPLCAEAMRLVALLLEHAPSATPATHALFALMCLHAARLPARVDGAGDLIPLLDQDRRLWDAALVAKGRRLLDLSATGLEVTEYHVEAAIASVHGDAASVDDTRWDQIVSLYDTLLSIRPSPVVALQRALAVAQTAGPERGIEEIRAIAGSDRLARYPFYFAALGELELRQGHRTLACRHFREALAVARNGMERRFIAGRIDACQG
jgi:RNA polymerase sigma factor (sigma-70 family)